MSLPWMLSLMVGFLSLSQEILWVRLVGFALGGAPIAFAFVLTCYLIGIAIGAAIGKRFCDRSNDLYQVAAIVLLVAAFTDPLPPLLGPLMAEKAVGVGWLVVATTIVFTAALKSILFPIAHHLGSTQSGARVATSVSNIYFGNIIGSTLGPILTGFILLDLLSVDACFKLIGAMSLIISLVCGRAAKRMYYFFPILGFTGAAILVAASFVPAKFVLSVGDRWFSSKGGKETLGQINNFIENKHGVIHTTSVYGRSDDVVFGGNAYDGRINTDVRDDSNGTSRLYMLAALHPSPRNVLVVGMSAGPWTKIVAGFSGVEQVDVVEINPGYIELMGRYPAMAQILTDRRINVHIDDGRRWLKRHPDSRFDLIVINTTFHWRANSTNLLSREFMLEAKRHLNSGGILAFNTTASLDAFKTAGAAFPFAYKFANFAYASKSELHLDPEISQRRLLLATMDGKKVFERDDFVQGEAGYAIAHQSLLPVATLLGRTAQHAGIITDANMLTEYRHGHRRSLGPLKWFLPTPEDVLSIEP